MKNKKPMLKETVGALYLAFNTPDEHGDFDLSTYEETIKSEVVKSIDTNDNGESTVVRASGKEYMAFSQSTSVENDVEVVAFDAEDRARMRNDDIGRYIIKSGRSGVRPFFAFGKVVKKTNENVEYVWYPKCQLAEDTDNIATSEESFSEQNDTLKIKAYAFDKAGNKSVRVNTEMSNFPAGLTEEMFFTKPITSDEEIDALINSNQENNNEQEGA